MFEMSEGENSLNELRVPRLNVASGIGLTSGNRGDARKTQRSRTDRRLQTPRQRANHQRQDPVVVNVRSVGPSFFRHHLLSEERRLYSAPTTWRHSSESHPWVDAIRQR